MIVNKAVYKVGDIWLAYYQYQTILKEEEIVDVAEGGSGKAIKLAGHGWVDAEIFHKACKVKIAVVTYKRGLFGKKRIVTKV